MLDLYITKTYVTKTRIVPSAEKKQMQGPFDAEKEIRKIITSSIRIFKYAKVKDKDTEENVTRKKPGSACFIKTDQSIFLKVYFLDKGYHMVPHEKLLRMMQKMGVSTKVLRGQRTGQRTASITCKTGRHQAEGYY